VVRLDWLVRPIAHRGLHDGAKGLIENTPSAFQAAVDAGFAIEFDVQPSADGAAMVFHDATLERLTEAKGAVGNHTAADLRRVRFKDTSDRMQTLSELLEHIAGRVPLVIEIKSDWGPRGPFEDELVRALDSYAGHVAVMSFDPYSVAAFARASASIPHGLVAGSFRNLYYWGHLSRWKRFYMRHLLSSFIARPHFIAYDIGALPAPAPWVWRSLLQRPLLTWTVRTEAERNLASRCADAMIFEGFVPNDVRASI
jgi:glycerophosphoryl diester phosphodiesterase